MHELGLPDILCITHKLGASVKPKWTDLPWLSFPHDSETSASSRKRNPGAVYFAFSFFSTSERKKNQQQNTSLGNNDGRYKVPESFLLLSLFSISETITYTQSSCSVKSLLFSKLERKKITKFRRTSKAKW